MSIKVIDLFCGAGGISLGLKNVGCEIIYANDIDKQFCETYSKNHSGVFVDNRDINSLNIAKEFRKYKGIDILTGGPPCQGFSQKGKRLGLKDSRNYLFKKFLEVVTECMPNILIMENVPNLITSENGYFYTEIENYLQKLGYSINSKILDASNYGVPQKRKRAFIIANRINKSISFPDEETQIITVEDAISDLPILKSAEGELFTPYNKKPQSKYQKNIREFSSGIYNHIATKHSKDALHKLSFIPPLGDKNDIPLNLRTKSLHSGTWSRINPKKPARTITTRFDTPSSGQFTLNFQDRCLTVREAARIQSFPDKFIFYGNKTSQMKQVGNAVPPVLAEKIGRKIIEVY